MPASKIPCSRHKTTSPVRTSKFLKRHPKSQPKSTLRTATATTKAARSHRCKWEFDAFIARQSREPLLQQRQRRNIAWSFPPVSHRWPTKSERWPIFTWQHAGWHLRKFKRSARGQPANEWKGTRIRLEQHSSIIALDSVSKRGLRTSQGTRWD